MTRKDFKLSDTSQGSPENFDLWEELEDKTGEKISGGAIFSLENQTPYIIDVFVFNGDDMQLELFPDEFFGDISIPGNVIFVEFDEIPGTGSFVREAIRDGQIGIFEEVGFAQIGLFVF